MKITINKSTYTAEKVIAEIIEIARQTAESGGKYFSYDYGSRENRNNLESQLKTSINVEVRKRTGETVDVCYRGDFWSSTKFYIKD